jgi:hypothetical protein
LPAVDAHEPNDDTGTSAKRLSGSWTRRAFEATVDFWDDQDDVYAVYVQEGARLDVSLDGAAGDLSLALWRPGTGSVVGAVPGPGRVRLSARAGPREHAGLRAPAAGWYSVQVRIVAPGDSAYRVTIARG